jgi:hypothetical protein
MSRKGKPIKKDSKLRVAGTEGGTEIVKWWHSYLGDNGNIVRLDCGNG